MVDHRPEGSGPRIALVVAGSRGDAAPFIALAQELRDAGARPVLLTHAEHQELAADAGVPFLELPGDPRAILATSQGHALLESRNVLQVLARLTALARELFDDVAAALERALPHFDVVVFSTLAVAAFHVAEALGLPRLWAVLQPVTPTRAWPSLIVSPGRDLGRLNASTYEIANALGWAMFGRPTDRYRRRLGLTPLGPAGYRRLQDGRLAVLGGWSPAIAPPPPDWPTTVEVAGRWHRTDTRALPPQVVDFLDSGPAPVYVGLGSATVPDAVAVSAMFAQAIGATGRRAIMSAGWAGLGAQLPESPQILVVTEDVNHERLFPRCVAVIHHMGAGTAHAVAAAGVPAVGVPLWGDQPFWARRLAALGVAAPPVPRRQWRVGRIAQALAQAADEPWRAERARVLARSLAAEAGVSAAASAVIAAAG